MFSTAHMIFIGISFALMAAGIRVVRWKKPSLKRLAAVCFPAALLSEAVKVLSIIEILPVVEPVIENGALVYRETGAYAPYLEAEHLPLELCSLQMLFMLLFLVSRVRERERKLLALIYGTAIPGGLAAIFLSSIAPQFETAAEFFTAPRAWQFFLYHSMIVVLGAAIGLDREYRLHFRDVRYALMGLLGLDAIMFYLNSVFSIPYYQDGRVAGIGYAVNFFSSYANPLGIVMTDKAQYLLYLLIRLLVGTLLILLVFTPFAWRDRMEKRQRSSP